MKHNIIKTENYLLVVDNSEIKEGWEGYAYKENVEGKIFKHFYTTNEWYKDAKKIIAHLPLNNSPILEGVDLLPPLVDIPELSQKWYNNAKLQSSHIADIKSFEEGYKIAKEKYKYTEEDMIEYSNWLFKWCEYNKYCKLIDGVKPYGIGEFISDKDMFDKFLKEKSLQQSKYPIGFECEVVYRVKSGTIQEHKEGKAGYEYYEPQTITNSQGITQWVGKYIY